MKKKLRNLTALFAGLCTGLVTVFPQQAKAADDEPAVAEICGVKYVYRGNWTSKGPLENEDFSGNCKGKVSYDSASKTLTLENTKITVAKFKNINLKLVGKNEIRADSYGYQFVAENAGEYTITGAPEASLDIKLRSKGNINGSDGIMFGFPVDKETKFKIVDLPITASIHPEAESQARNVLHVNSGAYETRLFKYAPANPNKMISGLELAGSTSLNFNMATPANDKDLNYGIKVEPGATLTFNNSADSKIAATWPIEMGGGTLTFKGKGAVDLESEAWRPRESDTTPGPIMFENSTRNDPSSTPVQSPYSGPPVFEGPAKLQTEGVEFTTNVANLPKYNGYAGVTSLRISPDVEKFTVTFDSNGGSAVDPASVEVEQGGKVTKPEDPTREGYTFTGWMNGEQAWDFDNDVVESAVTLTAGWDEVVTPEPEPEPEPEPQPEETPTPVVPVPVVPVTPEKPKLPDTGALGAGDPGTVPSALVLALMAGAGLIASRRTRN